MAPKKPAKKAAKKKFPAKKKTSKPKANPTLKKCEAVSPRKPTVKEIEFYVKTQIMYPIFQLKVPKGHVVCPHYNTLKVIKTKEEVRQRRAEKKAEKKNTGNKKEKVKIKRHEDKETTRYTNMFAECLENFGLFLSNEDIYNYPT